MGTIYNCEPAELVEKASEELKKVESIKQPDWAAFAKTGMHKERPPVKNDWWYTRVASILRQVYIHGPIGVAKLRTRYGGKKNRGMKKGHSYKGSGSIIRKALQQLEKAGFVKKEEKAVHKGKLITAEGKKFLDDISAKIAPAQEKPKKEAKPAEKKPAEKKEAKPEGKKVEVKEKPKAEVKPEVKKEEPKSEVKEQPKEEVKVGEKKEEPKAEVKPEEKKEEPKKEEAKSPEPEKKKENG